MVGTSVEDAEEALEGLRTQLLLGGPIALLLASALGYLVAGRALEPMERMRAAAATISAHRSGDRLPLPEVQDEVHRLGSTLNQMLDRLDASLRRERQFVAEASHELRTPLAILRTELDLIPGRSPAEVRDALSSISDEVDRLALLVDHLLVLACADDARVELNLTTFTANDLLTQIANRFAALADGRTIKVTAGIPVELHADRPRIDQAISNLVDNALRHGTGDVTLDAHREDGRVVLRVRDQGGTHLADALFERFTQGPGTRAGGRGLGLALVRVLVDQHGGTVSTHSRNGTTEVCIDLPTPATKVASV